MHLNNGVFINDNKIMGKIYDVGDNSQEYYENDFCMVKIGSGETCSQSDFNSTCTGSNSGSGCTQSDLDAQFEAGKQYCKNNPSACSISTGDSTPCPSTDSTTINADLSFSLPNVTYYNPFGSGMDMEANFKFFNEQSGKLLWELESYKVK